MEGALHLPLTGYSFVPPWYLLPVKSALINRSINTSLEYLLMKILIKYCQPRESQRGLRRPENHTWASVAAGEGAEVSQNGLGGKGH